MKQIIVKISDMQEKVLLTDMLTIEDWLQNAIDNKARKVIDRIVGEKTDRNPKKLSAIDKENIINSLVLKTAAEKQIEFEKEILPKE